MEEKKTTNLEGITEEEFNEFLSAKTQEERLKILLIHSEKNKSIIKRSNIMEQQVKSQAQIEKEMEEINNQFSEFLHTKGIVAKFKLAFSNMGEAARAQRDADKEQIEKVKAESKRRHEEAVNSKEAQAFAELRHTKGFKAKCRLIVENMKKSAASASQKTAAEIAKVQAQTQANIAVKSGKPVRVNPTEWTADDISREFNAFLKSKGLDGEYTVVIRK